MPNRTGFLMDFSANAATLQRLMHNLQVATYRDLLDRCTSTWSTCSPGPARSGLLRTAAQGNAPARRDHGELLGLAHAENGNRHRAGGMLLRIRPGRGDYPGRPGAPPLAPAGMVRFLRLRPAVGNPVRLWPSRASGASVFQHPTFLRGIENFLADMYSAPELYEYLSDRFHRLLLHLFRADVRGRPRPHRQSLRIADDVAMQDRLLMSAAAFDRFIAPRFEQADRFAHRNGAKVMVHCLRCRRTIDRPDDRPGRGRPRPGPGPARRGWTRCC